MNSGAGAEPGRTRLPKADGGVWIALDRGSAPATPIDGCSSDGRRGCNLIRRWTFSFALLTTLVVAGVTVHLQVIARLKSYELARARLAATGLVEARDILEARVARAWTPERVHALTTADRQARRQAEQRAVETAKERTLLAGL